jgi:hypothetical protein
MKIMVLSLVFIVGVMSNVSAHEKREVAGKYTFIVGFVNEPAFAGQPNGIDLRIKNLKGEAMVEGAEKTLKVTVSRDGKSATLPLEKKYKDPGRYAGYFTPTKSGSYVVVFEGTVEGTPIKEEFKAGEGKLHEVEEPILIP